MLLYFLGNVFKAQGKIDQAIEQYLISVKLSLHWGPLIILGMPIMLRESMTGELLLFRCFDDQSGYPIFIICMSFSNELGWVTQAIDQYKWALKIKLTIRMPCQPWVSINCAWFHAIFGKTLEFKQHSLLDLFIITHITKLAVLPSASFVRAGEPKKPWRFFNKSAFIFSSKIQQDLK